MTFRRLERGPALEGRRFALMLDRVARMFVAWLPVGPDRYLEIAFGRRGLSYEVGPMNWEARA